jgi:serine/threonine protein kinase
MSAEPHSSPGDAVRLVRPATSTASDDRRVIAAVEEYLRLAETGQCPSVDNFLATHAEIAELLRPCLTGLQFVQQAAADIEASSAAIGRRLVAEQLVGEPLGDFELIRELGRGGMGIVYEAQQRSLRRRVAVKVLPLAAMLDERRLERFQHEAAVAAMLKHPHIVSVYWVGCERGVHYYAMELIEGRTLAEIIRRPDTATGADTHDSVSRPDDSDDRPRAERDTVRLTQTQHYTLRTESDSELFRAVARLGIQAAAALEHAHAHGVIHRDIKPSNVMVGDQGHAWVTDFGLAHIEAEPSLTLTGDLVGTLRYMSPEQAAGQPALVDHRTDIYSLGATLYELATGQPVVRAHDRASILKELAEQEPVAPSRLATKIPRDLETILLKSLAKEPSDRYATAQQLADDLTRFLEDKPLSARRPGPLQHAVKWTRRHRVMVTTAVVTFLLSLIVGMLLVARAYRLEREQRQIAEQAKTIAEREKTHAERDFQFARQVVDDMYVGVARGWLSEDAAISSIQSAFLDRAREFYQRIADESPANSAVAAEAYARMGEIHQHLHECQEAAACFSRAIEMGETVAEPNSREYFDTMIWRYGRLGDTLQDVADYEGADRAYGRALDHMQTLMTRFPSTVEDQKLWARFYLGRANLLVELEKLKEAENIATQANDVCEKLHPQALSDLDLCVMLLKTRGCLADILRQQGRFKEARTLCEAAIELCTSRQSQFRDSRDLSDVQEALESSMAAMHVGEQDYAEAEQHFRRSLEIQRQKLTGGLDPIQFFAAAVQGKVNVHKDLQRDAFCGYVEDQLRLAQVLACQGRVYATEQVLGECRKTSQILCDIDPESLRYRVTRANSWAETGGLLAPQRPEESAQAWQYAATIWRDTIANFAHAKEYHAGLHGRGSDWELFQKNCPPEMARDDSLTYEQFKQPFGDTPFERHAFGLHWYRGGGWKTAIEHFTKAAELRSSGRAFDWLYIAMAHQQLGEYEQAREWYDKATEEMRQSRVDDQELLQLSRQTEEMLSESKTSR